jgi:2-dehydropantoate 2-reductase
MRFVVFGAGAIGGVIGGRLFEHGNEVVLIARGAHGEALRSNGLRLESPDGVAVLPVPACLGPADVEWRSDDVVVLAMKSQDTVAALQALSAVAPAHVPIVSAQNGVDNERVALRSFKDVYGICVMLPATHLEPGVVQANSAPVSGLLDIGRWPSGSDDLAAEIAAVLAKSSFDSVAREDISLWKYRKLLMNLGNAVQALCGRSAGGEVASMAREEGEECLALAGVSFLSSEDDAERRGDLLTSRPISGRERGGGSSWQSLARSTGTIEADYLNGEIVLLGRLHGFPTPVNSLLQRLAGEAARERRPPGSMTEEEILSLLRSQPVAG